MHAPNVPPADLVDQSAAVAHLSTETEHPVTPAGSVETTPQPDQRGSYRELLAIALPLVVSSGTQSLMHITDRLCLTGYSTEALAASLPAGILYFTALSLPFGISMQLNAFVAQYEGARRRERIGPVIWQGIWLAILFGSLLTVLGPFSGALFPLLGHPPEIAGLEATYFAWLSAGAIPALIASTLSSFFSGRGETGKVLLGNATAVVVNIILDLLLVFGPGPFPRWGIAGAAIATSLAAVYQCAFFAWLAWRPDTIQEYQLRTGMRIDWPLLGRVLKYGLPAGFHLLIDVAAWTFFVMLIGQVGTVEAAATNIAFNLNTLAFIPIIGLGIAISTLVGQRLGEDRPDLAERSVYKAFVVGGSYMLLWSAVYAGLPDPLLAPFAASAAFAKTQGPSIHDFNEIYATAVILLRYVAIYSLCDSMAIIFSSAIRAAGDTTFAMWTIASCGSLFLVLPLSVVWWLIGPSLWWGWFIATVYVMILGTVFFARFRYGSWKSMRMIETVPVELLETAPQPSGN